MEIRTYEREKLYKEVWAEPMTIVAKRYGISDVALRKHCKKLEIPLPQNGHWAKVKARQKIKIPPLPKTKGPDKIVVTNWSANNVGGSLGAKMSDTLLFLPEDKRLAVKEYCSSVTVPDELTHPHSLIRDTIQYLRSRKETTKPPVNRVITLRVSDEHKERAYRIFSTIFLAFEHLGYTIEIKYPKAHHYRNYERHVRDNVTYICLGQDGVPILLKEKLPRIPHEPTKEEIDKQKKGKYIYIPPYDIVNTGIFTFDIDEYHSKRKHWHDSDTRKIEDQIGGIIIWIMEAIHVVKTTREERDAEEIRRAEVESRRRRLAELRKHELELVELLEKYAADWDRAIKIRRFADCVELKSQDIVDVKKKEQVLSMLKWARDKADWFDPLVETEDGILGKSQNLFDSIDWED